MLYTKRINSVPRNRYKKKMFFIVLCRYFNTSFNTRDRTYKTHDMKKLLIK